MRVSNINTAILKQCREQMALHIEEAKQKIPSIEKIEIGEKPPTYNQLRTIANYYNGWSHFSVTNFRGHCLQIYCTIALFCHFFLSHNPKYFS